MRIVIIEDERVVAEDLKASITELINDKVSITILRSVKESISYFEEKPEVDMIFSDIQLGDGLSFEIFMEVKVTVPIVFCTAYDEYALDAFRVNGIDYILKPFTTETLQRALEKYHKLRDIFASESPQNYDKLMELLAGREKNKASSILVYFQDRIMPIKIADIAAFHLEHEMTHLITFTGKVYYPNKNLDELEKMTGEHFFRANRQFLVCRKAIVDVSSFFSRKLSLNLNIPVNEKVIVSKGKASLFLEWLSKAE